MEHCWQSEEVGQLCAHFTEKGGFILWPIFRCCKLPTNATSAEFQAAVLVYAHDVHFELGWTAAKKETLNDPRLTTKPANLAKRKFVSPHFISEKYDDLVAAAMRSDVGARGRTDLNSSRELQGYWICKWNQMQQQHYILKVKPKYLSGKWWTLLEGGTMQERS